MVVVLHAGAYAGACAGACAGAYAGLMWRAGLACLSDSIVRLHALVHAVAAAVAKALPGTSDSNPAFVLSTPLSASASSPPPTAAAAAAAAAADVRSSAQQLQFVFRDMIAFVRCVCIRVSVCAFDGAS
jgi:hypothetical protein